MDVPLKRHLNGKQAPQRYLIFFIFKKTKMETVVCCYMATQITQIKKIDNVNAEEE